MTSESGPAHRFRVVHRGERDSTRGRAVPSYVAVEPSESNGLSRTSWIKCEQVLTVDKVRLEERIGSLSDDDMNAVDETLRRVLAL